MIEKNMKNSSIIAIILLTSVFLLNNCIFSQDNWWKDKKYKSESMRIKYRIVKKFLKKSVKDLIIVMYLILFHILE